MLARLAHVAAVHRPWRRDPIQLGKPPVERRTDCRDLPLPAGSTGTGEDRASTGDDGGILHEGGIGESGVRREAHQREPQAVQRPAVGVVLLQCELEIGRPETG